MLRLLHESVGRRQLTAEVVAFHWTWSVFLLVFKGQRRRCRALTAFVGFCELQNGLRRGQVELGERKESKELERFG